MTGRPARHSPLTLADYLCGAHLFILGLNSQFEGQVRLSRNIIVGRTFRSAVNENRREAPTLRAASPARTLIFCSGGQLLSYRNVSATAYPVSNPWKNACRTF